MVRPTYMTVTVSQMSATTLPVRRHEPVAVINMDMLLAGDTPDVRGHFDGAVGKGPMVSCYNFACPPFAGTIAHDGLLSLAETVLKRMPPLFP